MEGLSPVNSLQWFCPWCPGYMTYKPAFLPQGIETHPEMRWYHRPVLLHQRHSGAAAAAAGEICVQGRSQQKFQPAVYQRTVPRPCLYPSRLKSLNFTVWFQMKYCTFIHSGSKLSACETVCCTGRRHSNVTRWLWPLMVGAVFTKAISA